MFIIEVLTSIVLFCFFFLLRNFSVFLKDVRKETLEDLITFIYCGKVHVEQEHLDQFLNTAKALQIKELADESYAHLFDVRSPFSDSRTPTCNGGGQFQSTHTVYVPNSAQFDQDLLSHHQQPTNVLSQQQSYFTYEDTNEMDGNDHGSSNSYDDEYYGSEMCNGEPMAMDQQYGVQANQLNANYSCGVREEPANPSFFNPSKSVKISKG